ncbi:filamentous hemagglutinin N-terminal domain-containing protein [[Phormidium] sp. LEGE 05292]|uniref:two-partner secretion domain-containing protein n=1 Tax=[Phormidium] sp. LEGE 05292 TaxID=767427 RepID=UPI001D149C1B|nr:filamentous hemagglutinin N-terminal domain-containing protein [Phormidium sp. LEGE 05292]
MFHSFGEFSVPTGGEAFFNNALDVQNIFSRVTGRSISNIDGLIRANGTANLFLINPNGIIFGPNAQLNIGGSFVASTASGIRFADGTQFNTTPNQPTSLLTISVPIGLQYGANPGNITVQGQGLPVPTPVEGETAAQQAAREIQLQQQWLNSPVGLGVQPGRTLALIGGNVALEGGILKAPSGRIELGSVADAGVVSLNPTEKGWALGYPNIPAFGNIQLSQLATVIASGEGGGDIQVQGGRVALSGESRIIADTLGNQNGGTVSVQTRQLSLTEGSAIANDTVSQGTGGNLLINTSEFVELIGISSNNSASRLQTITFSSGDAGDLRLTTRQLIVRDGAGITTSTLAQGAAGNLNINASESVTVGARLVNDRRVGGLFSESLGSGAGGNLVITTGRLIVQDGAPVTASTLGFGAGGSININAAESIEVFGTLANGQFVSNLATDTSGEKDAGNLTIQTRQLMVKDGALISTGTYGAGNAGNLLINATNSVEIVRTRPNGTPSQISSAIQDGDNPNRSSGNLTIETGTLSIRDGARLSTETFAPGNAGNIQIRARNLVEITGEGPTTPNFPDRGLNSTLSSSVLGRVGNGGNIEIETGRLSLQDGGAVLASVAVSGRGNGGNIQVKATERVDVVGTTKVGIGSRLETSLSSSSTGKAGNINIDTQVLSIRNGGSVSTTTSGQGDAGNLQIRAKDLVEVVGEGVDVPQQPELGENVKLGGNQSTLSSNSEEGVGNGGNLTIETGTLSIRDGGRVDAELDGLGKGGDIEVRASERVEIVGATRPRIFNGEVIRVSSTLSTAVGATEIGQDGTINQGGNINIHTPVLSLLDGGIVSSGLFGKGNAGNIQIRADNRVEIAGVAQDGNSSSLTTSVLRNSEGKGGNINIDTQVLSIRDGGSVFAGTNGVGNSGNIQIHATATVEAIGGSNGITGLTTLVAGDAKGEGGSITVETGRLRLQEGYISASTEGDGNAGSISLKASDAVELSSNSIIDAATFSDIGRGGRITIETGRLQQTGNSDIAAITNSEQPGGTITVRARESVTLRDGSALLVFTREAGNAGNLTVIAQEVDIAGKQTTTDGDSASGMFASSLGQGDAGSVTIETGRLRVRDGGTISVSSTKSGNAGNLNVIADFVELNNGFLGARTAAGNQGNINLRSSSLILRRNSTINTNATGTATGGNININTDILAALENSDISANSLDAQGGRVTINAQAIFGAQPRTREELTRLLGTDVPALLDPSRLPSSDITATGKDASLSGIVAVNTPEVNPNSGLANLPANPVDATALVASTCRPRGEHPGEFIFTGRGGLPPNPNELIRNEATWMDLREIALAEDRGAEEQRGRGAGENRELTSIVEAQGWMRNSQGQVVLVADTATATPQNSTFTPEYCHE